MENTTYTYEYSAKKNQEVKSIRAVTQLPLPNAAPVPTQELV